MSNKQVEGKGLGEESLNRQEERNFNGVTYALTFVGMSVAINGFLFGSSIVPPAGQLNIWQAITAIIVGLSICVVAITLNGAAGFKYGIPFTVQARATFGFKGSKIPALVRAVPAIFWYGIQTWIGAEAINGISKIFFGFDNIVLFFIIFQIIHMVLSATGFQGIKWLETVGSGFLIAGLLYLLYMVYTNFTVEISGLANIDGSWGLPFWAAAAIFLGNFNTLAINISDITRELNTDIKAKSQYFLTWIGLVPTSLLMGVIGLMVAGATGQWDPIDALINIVPSKIFLVIVLFFIALSQLTTNIINNVLPVAYVLMDIFKVTYVKATIIVGILAMLIMPGRILNASGFVLFVQLYSAFLGPIVAVMITDYYLVRSRKLDADELYEEKGDFRGINWSAIIAMVVGAVFAFMELDIGWFLSIIPASATYYLLMRFYPTNKRFLKGTKWEENMGNSEI